ncbi:hypothetical protein OPV22_010568 [Ensete ventricosum]|uniref:Uncharacterized protein n=1 Tax=Ensete ventricosum TaxID=4639 RepID=A0AAV8RHP4_ENSVE|nr:hypothetical protein OPV22_010568 [Ensete ventricosum]
MAEVGERERERELVLEAAFVSTSGTISLLIGPRQPRNRGSWFGLWYGKARFGDVWKQDGGISVRFLEMGFSILELFEAASLKLCILLFNILPTNLSVGVPI